MINSPMAGRKSILDEEDEEVYYGESHQKFLTQNPTDHSQEYSETSKRFFYKKLNIKSFHEENPEFLQELSWELKPSEHLTSPLTSSIPESNFLNQFQSSSENFICEMGQSSLAANTQNKNKSIKSEKHQLERPLHWGTSQKKNKTHTTLSTNSSSRSFSANQPKSFSSQFIPKSQILSSTNLSFSQDWFSTPNKCSSTSLRMNSDEIIEDQLAHSNCFDQNVERVNDLRFSPIAKSNQKSKPSAFKLGSLNYLFSKVSREADSIENWMTTLKSTDDPTLANLGIHDPRNRASNIYICLCEDIIGPISPFYGIIGKIISVIRTKDDSMPSKKIEQEALILFQLSVDNILSCKNGTLIKVYDPIELSFHDKANVSNIRQLLKTKNCDLKSLLICTYCWEIDILG